METKEKATSTANRQISVKRLLNAPVNMVFEVWTKPEHIKNWWGPRGFTNTISKMDFKNNGEWISVMHGPDGTNYDNKSVFVEIVKNEKIVLRHFAPDFELAATFVKQGNKTLLTITNTFDSAELLKKVVEEFGAAEGLKQNVDKLEEYLVNGELDSQLVISREFNAPRELVFKVWTDPTHFAKWWAPKGANLNIAKFDMVPGGMCLYSMKMGDAPEMWGRFVYREIVRPEKLVFVNSFADKDGNITGNPWMPVWPAEILNKLALTESNGKTTLTLKGGPINATAEEYAAFDAMKDNLQGGFKGTFDQLEEFLATITK